MVRSKNCLRCKSHLPLTEFYKNAKLADGHFSKCKACTIADVRKNRAENIERYREFDRQRANLPHRVEARKDYAASERGKAAIKGKSKEWVERNKEKRAAHITAYNHLRSHKDFRKPCERCGENKVQAHHSDYSKPLEVTWLCVRCHADWHKEDREKKRQMAKGLIGT